MPVATDRPPLVFALSGTRELGRDLARELGVPLVDHEIRVFDDGEHKLRPLVDVEGRDVFVVSALYGDDTLRVDEKLARMLFFLGTVHDAGAARVTALVPYLCYTRKDRRRQAGDPVTTRQVAQLLEAVGTARVATMDVHNQAAFENAFRIGTIHLSAAEPFAERVAARWGQAELAVVSPDAGGVKRAETFRKILTRALGREVPLVFAEKHREEAGLRGEALVGPVKGATAVVLDDLIASGSTLVRAARACKAHGAKRVVAAATHGLFTGDASSVLADEALDALMVADSIPPFRLDAWVRDRLLTVVPTAALWADAIRRMRGTQ